MINKDELIYKINAIIDYLKNNKVKLIEIQRSKGYSTRKSLVLEKIEKVIDILEPIYYLVLLILCTSFLIDASFNPFLYFRF